MAQQILSTNTFCEAKFVVDADASQGGYTTIGAALTAASSGSTIFIRPGTYTENLTLKAGVNLTAFGSDSGVNGIFSTAANVIINGTCTLSAAGTVTISGVQLETNSANCLVVSGSNACVVNLVNCYLNILNNTGISFTNSNAGSAINVSYCSGNLGTTGIALHSSSSAGTLSYLYTFITNGGNSITIASNSAGTVALYHSYFYFGLSSSSTGGITTVNSFLNYGSNNTICFTANGSGTHNIFYTELYAGSASALSIGAAGTVTATNMTISSTNTNAMTGAGVLVSNGTIFTGSSHFSNVTTQTGGAASGLTQGTAPSAGFIGEQIRSAVASPGVTLTSTVAANITSISLTAGIWDISGIFSYTGGAITGTELIASINTTSATNGTEGDNAVSSPTLPTAGGNAYITLPAWRLKISATTIVYLVTQVNNSVGTVTAFGRISATRVG